MLRLARQIRCLRSFATSDQLHYANLSPLAPSDLLTNRHIGPNNIERQEMLATLGYSSMDELISNTVPKNLPANTLPSWTPKTETQVLQLLEQLADKNQILKNFIGCGYYGTIVPPVIKRNILENPGWYTSYTPYQAEISQGRLESLLNYQTMVANLTSLPVANASLLDEATAAAEAMAMSFGALNRKKNHYLVSYKVFPQTIEVIKTRAEFLGIKVHVGDVDNFDLKSVPLCGVLVQSPDNFGEVRDFTDLARKVHDIGAFLTVGTDLLALSLIKSPGEMEADIAYGNSQRFGVPMGYGGPHAAFFSAKEEHIRKMPGRIIGVSRDSNGKTAYRMTMQTREQHIRREKATSNICTAQALLSNMAAMYAVYHGSQGISDIAHRVHGLTCLVKNSLESLGLELHTRNAFDTLVFSSPSFTSNEILTKLEKQGINLRRVDDNKVGVSFDETHTVQDVEDLVNAIAAVVGKKAQLSIASGNSVEVRIPTELRRNKEMLTHPVFNTIHSETQMLRYIFRLMNKDISLANSMISLGSCTMKLNATCEMIPVSFSGFGSIHPHVPKHQAAGYIEMIEGLREKLKVITAFDEISFQPNSGAQGEYAGLLTIRNFHIHNNEKHRNVCLIPISAHGTNPATATLAGMHTVKVECDSHGNVDLKDLKQKAEAHKEHLGAIMVTYPSTHGVFEDGIVELTDVVHRYGGQVYMDGANMNAQVGLTAPGKIGADVCHLNLHKTFAIPHGGGGPGMGPIGVKKHLAPFLPRDYLLNEGGSGGQMSAHHFGSASILTISYTYIEALGGKGLEEATKHAILNANYMMKKLAGIYPIVYLGSGGHVAHEFLIDLRQFKHSSGVTEEDIAKRLMDYGFHAPTMSFPIAGTLMIEPTESESKEELDLFCDALISIRNEIQEIELGTYERSNNVLKNAPHSLDAVVSGEWNRPYSREKAAFPLEWMKTRGKFWPTVGRVDNVWGDKNPVTTVPIFKLHI